MSIPDGFNNRVAENILDCHVRLDNGALVTDGTRADLVGFLDANPERIDLVIERLLLIEARVASYMSILDPEGVARRILEDEQLKGFFVQYDPATVFKMVIAKAEELSLPLVMAENLGWAHGVILKDALDRAAERAGCVSDIAKITAELRPRISRQVEADMHMSVEERLRIRGY